MAIESYGDLHGALFSFAEVADKNLTHISECTEVIILQHEGRVEPLEPKSQLTASKKKSKDLSPAPSNFTIRPVAS